MPDPETVHTAFNVGIAVLFAAGWKLGEWLLFNDDEPEG